MYTSILYTVYTFYDYKPRDCFIHSYVHTYICINACNEKNK